jgi:hypothetical protein
MSAFGGKADIPMAAYDPKRTSVVTARAGVSEDAKPMLSAWTSMSSIGKSW